MCILSLGLLDFVIDGASSDESRWLAHALQTPGNLCNDILDLLIEKVDMGELLGKQKTMMLIHNTGQRFRN